MRRGQLARRAPHPADRPQPGTGRGHLQGRHRHLPRALRPVRPEAASVPSRGCGRPAWRRTAVASPTASRSRRAGHAVGQFGDTHRHRLNSCSSTLPSGWRSPVLPCRHGREHALAAAPAPRPAWRRCSTTRNSSPPDAAFTMSPERTLPCMAAAASRMHLVAGVVAEAVVDGLEQIQIEAQHGQRTAAAPGLADHRAPARRAHSAW